MVAVLIGCAVILLILLIVINRKAKETAQEKNIREWTELLAKIEQKRKHL